MRQVGLIPSGCQVSKQNSILYYDEEHLIYASSLAVYVLNSTNFTIKKILSSNQRSIVSISVSSINKNLLAVSGDEGLITIWKIQEEEIICQTQVNTSNTVAWDPFSAEYCGILSTDALKLCIW